MRGFGLQVAINGQKSKLLLDTGAGGITINRKLAARAGLQRVSDIHIGGIGDKPDVAGFVSYAESIRIGQLEFHDCPVEVIDRTSVVDEEGLIGADVFSKFLIDLDFPRKKIRLSPLPPRPGESAPTVSLSAGGEDTDSDAKPAEDKSRAAPPNNPHYYDRYISPEMNSYARVFRFGHMLLVPTKVDDVPGKLFLIDSGAWNNTITPDAAREVTKVHGNSDLIVRGLSGQVNKVFETNSLLIEFGHIRQKQEDMVAFDLSHLSKDVGTEVSGTLGFAMLNLLRIKLDYRDALADFEYDPDGRRF
jgi:hypothetical protein